MQALEFVQDSTDIYCLPTCPTSQPNHRGRHKNDMQGSLASGAQRGTKSSAQTHPNDPAGQCRAIHRGHEAQGRSVTDVHTSEQRSRNMSAIRSKDTKPEIVVRRLLSRIGIRYRLHRKDLPGKPDIVMPGRKLVIFVHGCFFHMHKCRYGRVVPATNAEFWHTKRSGNAARDRRNVRQLCKLGWNVLTVWECETKEAKKIEERLRFLMLS